MDDPKRNKGFMYPLLATSWANYYKQCCHACTSSLCSLAYLILLGNRIVATLYLFCTFPLLLLLFVLIAINVTIIDHCYPHPDHSSSINLIRRYKYIHSQIMLVWPVLDQSSFNRPPASDTMHVTPLFVERKHKR